MVVGLLSGCLEAVEKAASSACALKEERSLGEAGADPVSGVAEREAAVPRIFAGHLGLLEFEAIAPRYR